MCEVVTAHESRSDRSHAQNITLATVFSFEISILISALNFGLYISGVV